MAPLLLAFWALLSGSSEDQGLGAGSGHRRSGCLAPFAFIDCLDLRRLHVFVLKFLAGSVANPRNRNANPEPYFPSPEPRIELLPHWRHKFLDLQEHELKTFLDALSITSVLPFVESVKAAVSNAVTGSPKWILAT